MEERFLESRKARAQSRLQRTVRHQKKEEKRLLVNESLQKYLDEWTVELQKIVAEAAVDTEEEKANFRLRLVRHDETLKELRKLFLAADTLSTLLVALGVESETEAGEDDTATLADLNSFHSKFSKCQAQLERYRKEKLPRGKFVFKRYRNAMKNRIPSSSEEPANTRSISDTPRKTRDVSAMPLIDPERSLCNLSDLNIVVNDDGEVQGVEEKLAMRPNQGTLTLFDLHRCTVRLCGNFQSVHVVRVKDSAVLIDNTVAGAIHVTDCQNVTLRASCQQVRLHDSSGLQCYVSFSAGAILEDCRRITFWQVGDVDECKIHDFNWLKNGIPSPNFCLEDKPPLDAESSPESTTPSTTVGEGALPTTADKLSVDHRPKVSTGDDSIGLRSEQNEESDDDDDDEL